MLDSAFAVLLSFDCEEPEAFRRFGASDGKTARLTANAKGLVAVYTGKNRDKCNLFRDIQRHWFWAIPADLADRLARTCPIKPQNNRERAFLESLSINRRIKTTIHISKRCIRYQLTDKKTIEDIKKQLQRIQHIKEAAAQY